MKLRPDTHVRPDTNFDLRLVSLNTPVGEGQSPVEPRTSREEKALSHTPGGRQARKEGCSCPMMHDRRGNITILVEGHPMMLIRKGCPVHTPLDPSVRPPKGERGVYSRTTGALRRRVALTKEEEQAEKDKANRRKEGRDAEPPT